MNFSPSFRVRGWIIFTGYMAFVALAFWRAGGPGELPPAVDVSLASQAGPMPTDGAIAVLDIQGPIALSMGGFGGEGAGGTLRRLRELREEKDVKAVILRINSPGGTVASVQEIHEAVRALQKGGKKVIASFQDVAASGGYYIAAPADRIVANPGSIVGSIGVIFHLNNLEELAKKVGVKSEVIKSGKMKDMGSPTRASPPKSGRFLKGWFKAPTGNFCRRCRKVGKCPWTPFVPWPMGEFLPANRRWRRGWWTCWAGLTRPFLKRNGSRAFVPRNPA